MLSYHRHVFKEIEGIIVKVPKGHFQRTARLNGNPVQQSEIRSLTGLSDGQSASGRQSG
jgi:hypothetical protein